MGRKRADGEGTWVHEFRTNKSGKTTEYWRYVITVAGKRKSFSSTGRGGKTVAKEKYDAWAEARKGTVVAISKNMTLSAWATMWMESTKFGEVTDDWYYQLKLMASSIPDELGHKKVDNIAPIELKKFLKEFSSGRSKSYSDKMCTFIRSLFRDAHENGACGTNPAKDLKRIDKIEPPRRAFTQEQAIKIVEFAGSYRQNCNHKSHKAIGQVIGAAIVTLLATGMRRGELLGLMWSDINKDKITINRAVRMEIDETDGKRRPSVEEYQAKNQNSLRTIAMPPIAYDIISRLPHYGLYVFGCLNGSLMIPNNFNRSYKIFMRDLRDSYPDIPDLNPHECRHTFATLSIDTGANIKLVQLMLGHNSLETTSRYLHPDLEQMQAAQSAIWCNNKCNNQRKQA